MEESHKIGELYPLIFTFTKQNPSFLLIMFIHVPYFAVYIGHFYNPKNPVKIEVHAIERDGTSNLQQKILTFSEHLGLHKI